VLRRHKRARYPQEPWPSRFLRGGRNFDSEVGKQGAASAESYPEPAFERSDQTLRRRSDAVRIGQAPGNRPLLGSAAGGELSSRTGQEQVVDVVGEPRRRVAQPGQLAGARVAVRKDSIVMLGEVAADRHIAV